MKEAIKSVCLGLLMISAVLGVSGGILWGLCYHPIIFGLLVGVPIVSGCAYNIGEDIKKSFK